MHKARPLARTKGHTDSGPNTDDSDDDDEWVSGPCGLSRLAEDSDWMNPVYPRTLNHATWFGIKSAETKT